MPADFLRNPLAIASAGRAIISYPLKMQGRVFSELTFVFIKQLIWGDYGNNRTDSKQFLHPTYSFEKNTRLSIQLI